MSASAPTSSAEATPSSSSAHDAAAAAAPSSAASSSLAHLRVPAATPADDWSHLILIAGGGIGGCALALALQRAGLRCLVLERDTCLAQRRQGYGLTMQQGRAALAKLGLDVRGVNSTAHFSYDQDGTLLGKYGRAIRNGATTPPADTPASAEATQASTSTDVVASVESAITGNHQAASASSSSGTPSVCSKSHASGSHGSTHNFHLPRQRLRSCMLEQLRPELIRWGVSVERYEFAEEDENEGGAPCKAAGPADPMDVDSLTPAASLHTTAPLASTPSSSSSPAPPCGLRVHLSDGSSLRCGLLVGADGLRSVLRAAKIGDSLKYLGVIVILGFARIDSPMLHRRVVQTCDGETRLYTMPFEVADGGNEATSQMETHGSPPHSCAPASAASSSSSSDDAPCTTMWQLSFPISESDALAFQHSGGAGMKAEALRRLSHWHHPIPELIRATREEDITGYPAYDRDLPSLEVMRHGTAAVAAATAAAASPSADGASSVPSSAAAISSSPSSLPLSPSSFVCLLGDAAHPMSPFKGQGANQALLDGIALADALHASQLGQTSAVRRQRTPQEKKLREQQRKKRRREGDAGGEVPVASSTSASSRHGAPSSVALPPVRLPSRPSLLSALSSFERAMLSRVTPKVVDSRVNALFLHSPAVLTPGNSTRATVAKKQHANSNY